MSDVPDARLLCFTRGRKTGRIGYYGLLDVKVAKIGKKPPIALAHFGWNSNFELLADAELPDTLAAEWLETERGTAHDEGRTPRPFPNLTPNPTRPVAP